jgi:hypothetical protein
MSGYDSIANSFISYDFLQLLKNSDIMPEETLRAYDIATKEYTESHRQTLTGLGVESSVIQKTIMDNRKRLEESLTSVVTQDRNVFNRAAELTKAKLDYENNLAELAIPAEQRAFLRNAQSIEAAANAADKINLAQNRFTNSKAMDRGLSSQVLDIMSTLTQRKRNTNLVKAVKNMTVTPTNLREYVDTIISVMQDPSTIDSQPEIIEDMISKGETIKATNEKLGLELITQGERLKRDFDKKLRSSTGISGMDEFTNYGKELDRINQILNK